MEKGGSLLPTSTDTDLKLQGSPSWLWKFVRGDSGSGCCGARCALENPAAPGFNNCRTPVVRCCFRCCRACCATTEERPRACSTSFDTSKAMPQPSRRRPFLRGDGTERSRRHARFPVAGTAPIVSVEHGDGAAMALGLQRSLSCSIRIVVSEVTP